MNALQNWMKIIPLSLYSRGTWIDSYEAKEHIKKIGISHTQVCHTLIGYTSGFMSTISKQPVLAKEVTCVGKGDSACRWLTKPERMGSECKKNVIFTTKHLS